MINKWLSRVRRTLRAQLYILSILGIAIALLLALGSSLWLNVSNSYRLMDQHMKEVAAMLAKTQQVQQAMDNPEHQQDLELLLQNIAEQMQDLDMVAVVDAGGSILAVGSVGSKIKEIALPVLEGDEGAVFLKDGQSEEGMERCAYAKIYSSNGTLKGFVIAGVYMRAVYKTVVWMVMQYLLIALVALGIGAVLAHRLASYIKSELQGYEPDAFRELLAQRTEIWDALEEGVMAIDKQENIIYLNAAAKDMLHINTVQPIGKSLHEVYPASTLGRVLRSGQAEYSVPMKSLADAKVLSDRMPIMRDGTIMGAVAIFRNRTEVTKMAEDLTGVRHIVEALRANTHEFMNKLHVILGLLQLEEYQEAERYVLELTKVRAQSMGGITKRIQEPAVAALLIGKLSRAQEQQVVFKLDSASRFPHQSRCLPEDAMISVLGNLIENAFDSFRHVASGALREVEVYIMEEAEKGLLICVEDTGSGITPAVEERMFERGFSTKGKDRGTGLALVQEIVQAYGGTMRVESTPGMGTTFTINIPVQKEGKEPCIKL